MIAKGGYDAVVAQCLDALKIRIAKLAPFLAERVDELSTWDSVKLLTVKLNRLDTWHGPGYLLIGDAARANESNSELISPTILDLDKRIFQRR